MQIPADAAATVRVSASADICTPADSDANVPPPTRAASPLPATLAPTALANFMGELYPDGLSSPMRHSSDVLLTLPLALGGDALDLVSSELASPSAIQGLQAHVALGTEGLDFLQEL